VAVLTMVEAHVVDSWTRDADRHGTAYFCAVFIAGVAAPLFLFLAGVTLAMAASSRTPTAGHAAAAATARKRGWQIFALAFLFRLQSQVLGWGALINFLKVDILNVMGLAMVAAGALWALASSRATRIAIFSLATAVATLVTPLLREAAWPSLLPAPLEWYVRPAAGLTTFTLFPWAGFLFAGVVAGDLVSVVRTRFDDLRLQTGLIVVGVIAIALG
jgi:uncharacterized membrane protein